MLAETDSSSEGGWLGLLSLSHRVGQWEQCPVEMTTAADQATLQCEGRGVLRLHSIIFSCCKVPIFLRVFIISSRRPLLVFRGRLGSEGCWEMC